MKCGKHRVNGIATMEKAGIKIVKHFAIFMWVVSHNLCFEMQCLFLLDTDMQMLTLAVILTKLDGSMNAQCCHSSAFPLFSIHNAFVSLLFSVGIPFY